MEWTKYTTKEALKDNDELMILDKDANANKRKRSTASLSSLL